MWLTDEQCTVVKTTFGRYLVIAGPGSGKTRVIIERTVYLLKNNYCKDEQILLITYTNKAADEMNLRLTKALGRKHNVVIKTYHAYAFSLVIELYPKHIRSKVKIIDEDEKKLIVENIIKDNNLGISVADAVRMISYYKNMVKVYPKSNYITLAYLRVYYEYKKYCDDHYKLDYDELLVKLYELLDNDEGYRDMEASSYKFIMVDEAQDENKIQSLIIKYLEDANHNLMKVGDLDQAIYGFRGSDSNLIKSYANESDVKVLPLSINFRSDGYIVSRAENLISKNHDRIDKQMIPFNKYVNDIDVKCFIDKKSEAIHVMKKIKYYHDVLGMPYKEIFILFRNRIDSTWFEIIAREMNIPVIIDGVNIMDRLEIKLFIKYLGFILDTDDDMLFLEVVNKPNRNIGASRLSQIVAKAHENKLSYYEASKLIDDKYIKEFVELIEELKVLINNLKPSEFIPLMLDRIGFYKYISKESNHLMRIARANTLKESILEFMNEDNTKYLEYLNSFLLSNDKDITDIDAVRLMTMHQSKGLEADAVFIVGANDEVIPGKIMDIKRIEEERNLMYVAVTRARKYCNITVPKKDLSGNELKKSRFIDELMEKTREELDPNYDDPSLPF